MLYLHNYVEGLLFILVQTNHFNVRVEDSLPHLMLRSHFWVLRVRPNVSLDSLGECGSLGFNHLGIFQGRARRRILRLVPIPMELSPRTMRRSHLKK